MARTLVVTNDFPPKQGGIENFVYQLVSRLPPEEVVVFTSSSPGAAEFDATLPFPVIRARTGTLLPTPHITRGAATLIERFGCDSVYFGAAASLGLMAARLRHIPGVRRLVGSSHSHECFWTKALPTRRALHGIGEGLDCMTYISDYCGEVIGRALSPAARARMTRLSPGVEPSQFWPPADPAPVRAQFGLAGRPVILNVSRLVPHKGQDTLIKALPLVLAAVPDAVSLIVGAGPERERLARLAARSGVDDAVRFAGPVPHAALAPFYAAADVFAFPTRDRTMGLQVEGLGMVSLEAQAAGLPVVVGSSGGAPETVRSGVTGYAVGSSDVPGLAGRLVELLSDPVRARAMGEAGRAWMAADWAWAPRAALLRRLLRPAV
ncbi:MAG: glycosyltransferase family 4 protein [Bifidobacteriaceae bacterium]|jgi:phosphatidylinositol alpha-1,6-mannosyltransferase|nr:glycosyltransferase family 4 protein [Bifidobacteriaceae bacterium]